MDTRRNIFVGVLIIIIGLVSIGLYKVIAPATEKKMILQTSDSHFAKGTIRIALDGFVGYDILQSTYFKDLMLADGYQLKIVDDGGDCDKRMAAIKNDQFDFAVFTVDSFTKYGKTYSYPATFCGIIDSSASCDGLAARKSEISSLEDLKNKPETLISYTANSPSEHLIKIASVDFDIKTLRMNGRNRVPVSSSKEALQKLLSGSVAVSALWEPELTQAKNTPGISVILSTKDMIDAITDTLVVNRKYLAQNPKVADMFLTNYFKALKYYQSDNQALKKEISKISGISSDKDLESIISGIRWYNLTENATMWFGRSLPGEPKKFGLYENIKKTIKIQTEFGDFTEDPLPDPREVIYSDTIANVYLQMCNSEEHKVVTSEDSLSRDFSALADWSKLIPVGVLKILPISFSSGSSELSLEAKENLDAIAETIRGYPNFRILIQGHTSPYGDEAINQILSKERAESVANYYKLTYAVTDNRIKVEGLGSKKPLKQLPTDTPKSYNSSLSRVEIHLMKESY